MNPDILIVRDDNSYRVLHGHLHLINALNASGEIMIEVKDQGKVKVMKTRNGIVVEHENGPIPVLNY